MNVMPSGEIAELFFIGNSQMGAFLRSLDWSQTSLGVIETWSPSLKTTLNILFNTNCPMLLVWGPHRILFYNDAYTALASSSHAPIRFGQSIQGNLDQIWSRVSLEVEQVFSTGQTLQREPQRWLDDQDGTASILLYTWCYSPLWDESGQVAGVFATGYCTQSAEAITLLECQSTDAAAPAPNPMIGDCKQTEGALKASEERFHFVTQAVNGLIFDWNLQTNEVYRSERLYDLIGLHPEETPPDATWWHERIHPEDRVRLQPEIAALFASSESLYNAEYRVRHENGHWVDVWEQACLIRDPQGQISRIVGCTVDISDRKQAEAALHQSETVLKSFFASSPIGMAFFDRNLRYVHANDALAAINGVPLNNHFGRILEEVLPQWAPTLEPMLQQVMETQVPLLNQEIIGSTNPSEQIRHCLVNYFPVCLLNGDVIGLGVTSLDITERRQAEEALRRSEERFRISQELSLDAFTILDSVRDETGAIVDFTWSYVNPKAAEVLKRAPADLIGQRLLAVLPGNQLNSELFARYVRVVETGESHNIELSYQADGITGWFRNMAVKIEDGVAVFFNDITDRKQIEEALRTSEERLRFAVEGAALGTWEYDLASNQIVWSERAQRMFGLSVDRADYQTFIHTLHPDDRDRVDAAVEQALAQQEIYDVEMRSVWVDSSVHWIRSIGRTRYNPEGVPTCMVGVSLDITDRKQAELEREYLLMRERYYVNQLQGLTQAALAINSALSVEQVLQVITRQAASTIGAHQCVTSMTIDQNWAQAINAVHLSEKYAQWRDYDEPPDGSGIYACVCHLNRPFRMTQAELEAHPRWRGFGQAASKHPPLRGWLAAPLIGRNGQNIGLIQLSDKCEGEFTETDESILVQLAQMASVAVENARLYEAEQQARAAAEAAREEAQAANRIKDEFLAVLSHELRSPLNPILGWSRLLQTRQFDQQGTQRALQTIERNAKLQTQLIDDLLDVSRILRGKLVLNMVPVNLATVIEAALETIRLAAEAKAIDLRFVVGDTEGDRGQPGLTPVTVLGDSARLQQIVWNLLSNAVKFTSEGGRVGVRLRQSGRYAQIQVQDTGKGITPEFLPYVFDYFRQEDGKTTRKFGGLGLGLAIVRHLAELHGGTVQAESAGEGQGAHFTVQLPLMVNVSQSGEVMDRPSSVPGLSDLKILLVDDDADMRDLAQAILAQQTVQVRVAASAAEALVIFDQQRPDILISDIGMPDMDGYMLIEQIRRRSPEQGGLVPAIALTAYAGESDQQQALKSGFQKHLPKPIEPESLIKTVFELTAPKRKPDQTDSPYSDGPN